MGKGTEMRQELEVPRPHLAWRTFVNSRQISVARAPPPWRFNVLRPDNIPVLALHTATTEKAKPVFCYKWIDVSEERHVRQHLSHWGYNSGHLVWYSAVQSVCVPTIRWNVSLPSSGWNISLARNQCVAGGPEDGNTFILVIWWLFISVS